MRGNGFKVFVLCIVLFVLYALVYYQFLWTAKFDPEIEDLSIKIQEVKRERDILDQDLANIETLRRNLGVLNIQDERFDSYLTNESNASDTIEYIDKLDRLFGNSFEDINFVRPIIKTSGTKGKEFYELAITFKATLSLGEVMNLIDYLEGGSKKVKIPKLEIQPELDGASVVQGSEDEEKVGLYKVDLAVNLYSLNIGNLDKVYEYSRQRFNRFHRSDDINFSPIIGMTIEPGISNQTNLARQDRPAGGGSTRAAPAFVRDINILLYSFLSGGQNFTVYNRESRGIITFKTKITPEVKLSFNGNSVDVYVIGDGGKTHSFNGIVTGDVINIGVTASFPLTVEENKDLGVSVQVINDSGKQIRFQLDDVNRKATLLDRNGNRITRNSQVENLRIV